MATVEKDIKEESAKIKAVRRIVRKRADNLDDKEILPTPISDGPNWKDLVFSHPERCVRIGTLFSGIGAIEHAFQRLGLNHKIVFAGDIELKCKISYFANYKIYLHSKMWKNRCGDCKCGCFWTLHCCNSFYKCGFTTNTESSCSCSFQFNWRLCCQVG